MKASNTRFYISPVRDGGYLLEKIQDCTVVERFTGHHLNPDEVAKSLETKGFTNISILSSPVSENLAQQCVKNVVSINENRQ